MKKLVLFVLFVTIAASVFAQRPTAKKSQLPAFYNSTMYVVLNDAKSMGEYSAQIKQAVQKNWRVTKYDFISSSEFESKRLDPNNSFLILNEVTFKDKNPVSFDFISVIIGGNYADINTMPEVCSFPISASDSDGDEAYYKLSIILGFMNQHLKNMQENPKLLKDKKYNFYTKQKKGITKKTLYLIEEEQIPQFDGPQKIRVLYKGKVVMMPQEELASLIKKRATNVAFLHKVVPVKGETKNARCYIILMGTDNTLYYFNYHVVNDKMGNGITLNDWKKLAKFIN